MSETEQDWYKIFEKKMVDHLALGMSNFGQGIGFLLDSPDWETLHASTKSLRHESMGGRPIHIGPRGDFYRIDAFENDPNNSEAHYAIRPAESEFFYELKIFKKDQQNDR